MGRGVTCRKRGDDHEKGLGEITLRRRKKSKGSEVKEKSKEDGRGKSKTQ